MQLPVSSCSCSPAIKEAMEARSLAAVGGGLCPTRGPPACARFTAAVSPGPWRSVITAAVSPALDSRMYG
jgi:hypothetical protein